MAFTASLRCCRPYEPEVKRESIDLWCSWNVRQSDELILCKKSTKELVYNIVTNENLDSHFLYVTIHRDGWIFRRMRTPNGWWHIIISCWNLAPHPLRNMAANSRRVSGEGPANPQTQRTFKYRLRHLSKKLGLLCAVTTLMESQALSDSSVVLLFLWQTRTRTLAEREHWHSWHWASKNN